MYQPEYFMFETQAALDCLSQATDPATGSLFRDDWQERIKTFLHAWMRERQLSLICSPVTTSAKLVLALHAEGAFKGKSASNTWQCVGHGTGDGLQAFERTERRSRLSVGAGLSNRRTAAMAKGIYTSRASPLRSTVEPRRGLRQRCVRQTATQHRRGSTAATPDHI